MPPASTTPEAPRRLLRHPIGLVADAARAFRVLVGDNDGFWFDSAAPAPGRDGRAGRSGTHYLGAGERVALDGGVLDALRAELAGPAPLADDDAPDFRLGLVGWLEYELRGETLGVPVPVPVPPARWLRVDRALAIDAATGEGELLALGRSWDGELAAWRDATAAALAPASSSPAPPPVAPVPSSSASSSAPPPVPAARRLDDDAEYARRIRTCLRAIADGDAYQLCLTTRLEVPGAAPDPVELLARLRASSPTHHAGLVRIGDTTLVSASPERFVRVDRDGRIESSPIKGTRRRDADPADDDALRGELLASEKERAENLMIVDLVRNDLSRVCEVGSVAVERLFAVESYAHVHQLVSTVAGRLAPGAGVVDAIAALFPAGSMTGAPKRRATELLAAIEGRPRGVYAGAFGWIGLDGASDLAMVIRSVVIDPRGASIGTGGGITASSDPAAEVAEMRLKAAALLAALGADDGNAG